jgi:hypothetical protein
MPAFEAFRRKREKIARVIPRKVCLGFADIRIQFLLRLALKGMDDAETRSVHALLIIFR